MKARDHPNGPRLKPYGTCQSRDQSINEKEMGDRSAISTLKDTLDKASRVYDNARNVKDFEGRAVDGNALPLTDAACPHL